jgi:hypothetical protein
MVGFLASIKQAYTQGREYSKVQENIFWFGHQLTSDSKEYFYPREFWEKSRKRLEEARERMGRIERMVFELGDSITTLHSPISLIRPSEICPI